MMSAIFSSKHSMAASDAVDRGDAPARLRLALHGAPLLHGADGRSHALERRDAAILAYLALEGPTPRTRLLELLWPDTDSEAARNTLRQRLFQLKRRCGGEPATGAELLALAADVIVDGDAADPLLQAHDYSDCPEFERWLDEQRRALAARRRAQDAARIDACERDGRYAEGAALAERLVAADALDETAVQRLMKLRYLDGQRAAAIEAFDRFAAELRADHGGVPARATTELLATIRAASGPLVPVRSAIPASVLRPPRLIGRDAELRRLHAAWSAGRAFWLLGEAGLGKTRLIAEFVADAFDALIAPARPGDAGVPYASLGRALRALLERRPVLLERAQRGELARVMPEIDGVAQGALGLQLKLQRAIEALLADGQRAGLVGLIVDDLHFADSASLEMLQALVLSEDLAGLRWGFAQRPADGAVAVEALRTALEEVQQVELLALAPLNEQQIAELVNSLGIGGLDASKLAPLLARHTGGNPMYALETIKHLIANDALTLDNGLPRPASVGHLIERRLRQLSAQALGLARVAAVAGVDFSIELAESVLDVRALALADAWRDLEAAQVLRGNAFAHDLVHEATLAGVPAPIAAHTHGAVAAWLEQHGGEPARIAAHWLDAAQPQRALKALHAAADAAKRAMRRKEEAAFLARAAQIESDAGDHEAAFASLRTLIEAALVVDLKAVDAEIFDRLDAEASTDGLRAEARCMRSGWLLHRGEVDAARRYASEAIDLSDAVDNEPTAAVARIHLARILDWKGEWEAALALLQPLLPWVVDRADDESRLGYYNAMASLLDSLGRGREARVYHQRVIELARGLGEWSWVVTCTANYAVSWATSGHTQQAIGLLREALRLVAAHDAARGSVSAVPVLMYACLRDCGRYDEALQWMETAPANEAGQFTAAAHCHFACGWMHLGQHARAQREIDAALKLEPPAWLNAKALQMRGRLALALGRRPGALLDDALAITTALPGRVGLRASIALDHALTLPPASALAAARDVVAIGERLEQTGIALAGHIRATRFAVDAGSASAAAMHADAARAIGDDIAPSGLYTAERWLNAWRAFRLAGRDDDAAAALSRGVEWVRATSRDHVPEPFRDSFARANAVNLELLRAAAAQR